MNQEEVEVPDISQLLVKFAIPIYLILTAFKFIAETVVYFAEIALAADVFENVSFDNLKVYKWASDSFWRQIVEHREAEVESQDDEEEEEEPVVEESRDRRKRETRRN